MTNLWQERTRLILKDEGIKKLSNSKILIVGVGGVGGTTSEMLCRAGIGSIDIVDNDDFSETNLNRQIFSNSNNIGNRKTEEAKKQLLEINPNLKIKAFDQFLSEENVEDIVTKEYDIVIDAIDTLSPKLSLITHCHTHKIKLISSMGAGGKRNCAEIKQDDISKTYNCGLAKFIRKRLKKRGIYKGLPVVFSYEALDKSTVELTNQERNKKSILGVVSYMPTIFACHISEFVINYLLDGK